MIDARMIVPHGVVSTHVWACDAHPEQRGYLEMVRRLTIREVFESLCEALELGVDEWGSPQLPPGIDEYFHTGLHVDGERPWPDGRMVVYVVTGGSEGHYIHVDVHSSDHVPIHETLMLGKTFAGWEAAWDAARVIGNALGV